MDRRSFLRISGAASAALMVPGAALAKWWPRRPISIVVPFPAGGGTDTFGRAVANGLQDRLGVPVNVVNKAGGGGVNGATEVSGARPDGQTWLVTTGGALVMASLFKDIPIDPFADLQTVGQVGSLTAAVVVPTDSPYETLEDLAAAAKVEPGSLRWAHTGRGVFLHVAGQSFLDANEIAATDVPFKGGAKVRAAVVGSQVDFAVIGIHQAMGFENEMRVLGLIAPERDEVQPDVPTVAELGFNYEFVNTPITMHAPLDVDPEVLETVSAALAETVASPEYAETMRAQGLLPDYLDGAATETRLRELEAAVRPVIQAIQ